MTSQENYDDEYLDDPIQLIDFEQRRITNQFDINIEEYDQADSEGELFIQKSDSNIKKKLFRNQSARTTITLPVTFFDIAKNVEYLNDCRPLFVKIVDCDKHPWYHKKYLRSNEKLNEEIIDVGVEDFLPNRNEIDCLEKSVSPKDMHYNQQSKPKIRPVETPYEKLKNRNAEISSPNSDTPLREWQKVIKQKALDQRNESQVDFRKNQGLIGLKISHATETITPEKQHHSKKGKSTPKSKNEDIKSKNDKRDTKQKQTKTDTVKNSNIKKIIDYDDHIKTLEKKLPEIRNNEVTSNNLAPRPDHIKEPHSLYATPAKKTPDSTTKGSHSVNLTTTHSGSVIPITSESEILEKLPKSPPAKNHPKTVSTPNLTATSSTLNQAANKPSKPSKNNDETLVASVSTNLSKLPNLIVTSPKKGLKLSDSVHINPAEGNTSSSSLPKPSECIRATNTTKENDLNLVQSHFFSQEQGQKQKNKINEKLKRIDEDQQTISITESTSATSNKKNKTLISLLNRKVLNYDHTDKTIRFDSNVPKDCKLDKTKKTPPKKKTDKSIISSNKKSNNVSNGKLAKARKNSNKIDPKRFTEFKETLQKNENNERLNHEGSQTKEIILNGKNEKIEKCHRSKDAASEPTILENEKKRKEVDPLTKATPAHDHKIKVLSARIVNKADIEHIVGECKTRQMGVINENSFKLNLENPSSSGAETCKPLNPADFKTDSEVSQTAVNYGQTIKNVNTAPPSFQIQRDKLPVILNKLQGAWVSTPQMSVPLNNSVTNGNLKQNAHNSQITSKKSCINVTISASTVGAQATLTNTSAQKPINDNILTDHRNASKITTKPALKSPFVMKMGENVNIPCHLNTPPQTTNNFKIIRRKSVPAYDENKVLEVYSNVIRLSNNVPPNNATPQRTPASTVNINVPLNQAVHATSPANLKQYNINSACHAQPINTLITLKKIQQNGEANFPPAADKKASHLQNSRTLCNFNAAAEQIMPRSRNSQQFLLGKLSALQENGNATIITNRQSAVQSTQPKIQPNSVTPNDLGKREYTTDPRLQRQLPPTCDVVLPQPETSLKSRLSLNIATPATPFNHTVKQEIVNNSYNPNENWHPQMTHMPQNFNMPSIVQASKQVVVNNSQHPNQPIQVQKNLNPNLYVPPPSVPSKQTPKIRTNTLWVPPPSAPSKQAPKLRAIYNTERRNEPMRLQSNPKRANFNVPPPSVSAAQVNTQQLNGPLHLQTTLTPPYFNVPPPSALGNQGSNQGMVLQPIPILQRDIQPGYRSDMHPHFLVAGPSGDMSMQHPVYPQQFIQQEQIDYGNSVPKNLPVNTMPYHMHSAWNCFYPNAMMPPPPPPCPPPQCPPPPCPPQPCPPPPCPPQHNLKQQSRYVFNEPYQTDHQLTQSVAGATVIGYNNAGLVKKININASTVDTNDKQDPVNSAICNENVGTGGVPLGFDIAPVTSKKEMMEELTRATAVISPPRSPVNEILKYCAEKAKNLNDTYKAIPVSSSKEPMPSLSQSNEQVHNSVLDTESKNHSSPSKIDRNVNNDTSTSSPNLHIKDLKRRHPQQNDISETVTQTLIKRPKPGPLSRKRVFTERISDDRLPVPHKGYSPPILPIPTYTQITERISDERLPVPHKGYSAPILPIPTYTKSLEILAKSNQLEMERRMDYAENHLKESEINNAVATSQTPRVVPRNKVTEEENEQQEKATKKISLDEYKQRGLKTNDSKDETKVSEDQIKLEIKRESHDQDLGYDSDSTVRG